MQLTPCETENLLICLAADAWLRVFGESHGSALAALAAAQKEALGQTRSTAIATEPPPPRHSVASP
jgi:hypothetical protein